MVGLQPCLGPWKRCSNCTLLFADFGRACRPRRQELFKKAYRGGDGSAERVRGACVVSQRQALIAEPELWFCMSGIPDAPELA